MLMDSDSGQNLELGSDNSLQKVLTRTMLNQEEIFRNQVLELHRLYEIQKIVMKEDFRLDSGERPYSFVGPFSENMKCESLITEMKLREVHTICSSVSVPNHCLKEHRGKCQHHRISLDLNLAASRYTDDNGTLFCDCVTSKVSALRKHGIYNDRESYFDEFELSLRAGVDAPQKSTGGNTCKDMIICSPSSQAFHSEGSNYGGDRMTITKKEFVTSCSFLSKKNDSFDRILDSQSLRDGMINLSERNHFHQGVSFNKSLSGGVEQCQQGVSCGDTSARRRLFSAYEVGDLDLNKAPPDDSAAQSIDPWIFNPSQPTSPGVEHSGVDSNGKANIFTVLDHGQPKNNCSVKSSLSAQQDIAVSTLTITPSKDNAEDFVSVCGSVSVSGSRNFRPENAESETCLPEKTSRRICMPELNVMKKKEDKLCPHYSSLEIHEGTDSNLSPVSCKSDLITDDESTNTKTGHCIGIPNSESSLIAKKLVQQSVVPSSEMKHPEKELAEVDSTVRKGAISLLYLSLDCLTLNQDYGSESKKRKKSCVVERAVPETSSDSYESMLLKQPECSVDEYCVTSAPYEETSLDKKDLRIKLKRGRRMKDFRKDILPGLSSLSRQEISEDIKIMEFALRSREYKKYRAKTASCSDPVTPVRSRRSNVGQRYHS